MFYLALSRAHCNQGLLSVSCSASKKDTRSWEGAQPGQWPEHRMSWPAQKLGEGTGWDSWLLSGDGMRSGGSEQLSCASLIFLGVYFFLFLGSLIIIIIIFQSLNCSYLNPGVLSFFLTLLFIPWGGRVRSCMILSCQLGLKYTSPSRSSNSLLPFSWLLLQPIWSPFSYVLVFLFHLSLNLSCWSCSLCFASPPSSTIFYLPVPSTTFVAKTTQCISGLRQLPHLQCLDCRRKIRSTGEAV